MCVYNLVLKFFRFKFNNQKMHNSDIVSQFERTFIRIYFSDIYINLHLANRYLDIIVATIFKLIVVCNGKRCSMSRAVIYRQHV